MESDGMADEDILGAGFQACTFEAAGADGVQRTATLVRVPAGAGQHRPASAGRAGPCSSCTAGVTTSSTWTWPGSGTRQGYEFYALDMHNHGRSLRPGTPGGYVARPGGLRRRNRGGARRSSARCGRSAAGRSSPSMGHSTGGLVAALWADAPSRDRRRSWCSTAHGWRCTAVPGLRRPPRAMVAPLARFRPEAVLRLPERGFYWRTISSAAEGEWTLDDRTGRRWPFRSAPAG